jgi:hypothetical protein
VTEQTYSPSTAPLSSGAHPREIDYLADLDREELACAGLRRVSDDFFADLYREALLEAFKPPAPVRARRQRKASIRKQIAAAERSGKTVTSITTPDGVTLHFGKGEPTEASNPWLDDLKVTKQ